MSSIDNAKRAAGWLHPNDRASCRNCKHGEQQEVSPGIRAASIYCTKHGFITQLYAICNGWANRLGVRA